MTARAFIAALGLLLARAVPVQAGVDRPPQFVVMAFDNCTELERWQELTDFAAALNKDGDRIHFTFFVSGINFIADSRRNIYEGPHQRRGYSRISFGGSTEAARQQTLQTYLHYFKTNYAGNRAPVHIGHHFMNYQGGAYNEALKAFARTVCGLPEVRCVTYAKLADFLDRQNAEALAAYRRGDFVRATTPALNVADISR